VCAVTGLKSIKLMASGLLAKGYKTRAPKKQSSQYIIERKKK
jgi:hypothetical protein